MSFDLIAISPKGFYPDEVKVISGLFEEGLKRYHIRKPEFDEREMRLYLENLPAEIRKKASLHSFHYLAQEYDVRGLHHNHSHPYEPLKVIQTPCRSASCHNFTEIEKYRHMSYVFFSPVFESISKKEYKPKIDHNDIRDYLQKKNPCKIYALGGINYNRFEACMDMGFDGAVLHGALWEEKLKAGA